LPASPRAADPQDIFWTPVSSFSGQAGFVDAIRSTGEGLYLGGTFDTVDGIAYRNCVYWDGKRWTPVGGAVGTQTMGVVHVVQVTDAVYVAGMFDQVSGFMAASNIARWDGANWDTMEGGTNFAVRSLAADGAGGLYVGGEFSRAGGNDFPHLARWDGAAWQDVGGGVDHHVMAVLVRGNDVYVGGRFATAGGEPLPFLARWDGVAWSPVGGQLNGFVTALAWQGNDLYAGGGFSHADGHVVNGVARWDGSSWHALGQGVTGPGLPYVRTLLFDGQNLYAGGFFTMADGKPAKHIARWDGSEWSPLGSGLDDTVKNIARHDGELYVTGEFYHAGGKHSRFVARWNRPSVLFERVRAAQTTDGVKVVWDVVAYEKFAGFRVYRRENGGAEVARGDVGPAQRSLVDGDIQSGVSYEYTVAAMISGGEIRGAAAPVAPGGPSFAVFQNYPNPFNPRTTIEYTVPAAGEVRLTVFDPSGSLVRTLVDGARPAGPQWTDWDGRDQTGVPVGSGVYFYRLEAAGQVTTKKMVLVK
jgi:hypothetical protein